MPLKLKMAVEEADKIEVALPEPHVVLEAEVGQSEWDTCSMPESRLGCLIPDYGHRNLLLNRSWESVVPCLSHLLNAPLRSPLVGEWVWYLPAHAALIVVWGNLLVAQVVQHLRYQSTSRH